MTTPKPLKRQSLAFQLREQMEELIRTAEWPLGSRIPAEAELARQFGVSHNTLREAVQGLIHAGLLRARPGDGTYVIANDRLSAAMDTRFEEVGLERILEARLAMEKALVELAAHSRSEQDLTELTAALDRCKRQEGKGIEADLDFHCRLADAAGNPILSQLYRILAGHLGEQLSDTLQNRQYEPEALAYHDELLDALRARDVEGARGAVEKIVAFDYAAFRPDAPPY